jgi:hypothetical protein
MVRECVASLLLLPAPGCSWILDFSERPIAPDATPAIDAPYDQTDCDYKEPNDTVATAATLTPAETGPAAICPADDHDFFKLTIDAAATTVELRMTHAAALGDLDLRLHDSTGTQVLAASRGFGDDELIICPGASPPCAALTAGDYLLEVFPATAGVANRYTLAITTTAP